jgi:ABC-2 type transport system ATP-binding protein
MSVFSFFRAYNPHPMELERLMVELIAYLRHRQLVTSTMVDRRARQGQARDAAAERRHGQILERVGRVEDRLASLDERFIRSESPVRRAGSLLRVDGLAKEIGGADILKDISFEVYEREILGLIGPNGAGKTTLLECLAGMRSRTAGTFFVGDEAPAAWEPKDLLFYLPNNVLPYGDLYTVEVLTFFGQLYEVDQRRCEQIVVHDLSLGPVLGKRVSALSKGNMQRLLLAMALMSPQPLLALDEPFDGLDLHQTQAMMGILRGLRAESRTLLLCIHQLNDAERICDRFLLLSAGRLVGAGTLAELREQTGLSDGSLEDVFLALT